MNLAQQTIFCLESPEGLSPFAGISTRDRLLKQLCALNIDNIFLVSSKNIGDSYQITANEKTMQVTIIDSREHIARIKEVELSVDLRDNHIYLNAALNTLLKTHKTAANSHISAEISAQSGMALTAHNRKKIEKLVFANLSKPTDGIVSRKINRPMSTFISRYLVHLKLPPIIYTLITGVLAILMIAALLSGHMLGALLGCVLFQICSMFDGVDGEIARVTYSTSAFGARLDTGIDMITNVLFFIGIQYALWVSYQAGYIALGTSILILALLGIGAMTALLYFGPGGGSFDVLAKVIKSRFRNKAGLLSTFETLNNLFKRDFFAFFFMVLALFGLQILIPWFLIFGLIVWNCAILLNAKHILSWNPSL